MLIYPQSVSVCCSGELHTDVTTHRRRRDDEIVLAQADKALCQTGERYLCRLSANLQTWSDGGRDSRWVYYVIFRQFSRVGRTARAVADYCFSDLCRVSFGYDVTVGMGDDRQCLVVRIVKLKERVIDWSNTDRKRERCDYIAVRVLDTYGNVAVVFSRYQFRQNGVNLSVATVIGRAHGCSFKPGRHAAELKGRITDLRGLSTSCRLRKENCNVLTRRKGIRLEIRSVQNRRNNRSSLPRRLDVDGLGDF